MTDKPKPPETPGMAEVSAKFVAEAEAAVEASTSTDEALSTLWQEHERLIPTCIDQNPWAHLRCPMDMIVHG